MTDVFPVKIKKNLMVALQKKFCYASSEAKSNTGTEKRD